MATLVLTLLGLLVLVLFYQIKVLNEQVDIHQRTLEILIEMVSELKSEVEEFERH